MFTYRSHEESIYDVSQTCLCAKIVVSFLLVSVEFFGFGCSMLGISDDASFKLYPGVLLQG
jgi:hypothetical protein